MDKIISVFLVVASLCLLQQLGTPQFGLIRAQSQNCTFTIPTSTGLIDGRIAPYNQIRPGDTICLTSGVRGGLTLKNIQGTIDRPITIINHGGQVVINTANNYGFFITNSSHLRLTGTGSADAYGIKIQKALTFGILAGMKTEYLEVDRLEFNELLNSNIAIHIITNASCPAPNGRNNDDYDYNNDGLYNSLDVVTRQNFTQHDLKLHDNKFQGFERADGSISLQMAYYIGNSNFSDIPYTRTCINPDGSTTSGVVVENPVIEGVYLYNNIIDTLGDKTLQVGSAVKDCYIHDNRINRGALEEVEDIQGLSVNPGSVCEVYNNLITNTRGNGITYQGDGGKIYNNVIANVGLAGTYWHDGIYVMVRPSDYHHGKNTYIFNNTIINTVGYGITLGIDEGTDNRIQNNLIINSGSVAINASYSYHKTVDHNYIANSLSEVKFSDPNSNNYSLQSDSPVIDAGINVADFGISEDFAGITRPQGQTYDIGAYEYESESESAIAGDANGDRRVDGIDYVVWLNHYNLSTANGFLDGDFNQNGYVDGVDYVIWLNNMS